MVTIDRPELVEQVTACPCCGTLGNSSLAQPPALLAVCDVLVVRALEVVGKRIIRDERSRYGLMKNRPRHIAHTIWRPRQQMVDQALAGAWEVVPAMLDSHGCCGVTSKQVTVMLDSYVRDLLITGTGHSLGELRYRLSSVLGVEVAMPDGAYLPDDDEG